MELLFTKRKRAREEAEARARGEPVDYLVREAPQEFRFQLWYALERAVASGNSEFEIDPGWGRRRALGLIATKLAEEYGRGRLSSRGSPGDDPQRDLQLFVLNDATTEQLMDVISVVSPVLDAVFGPVRVPSDVGTSMAPLRIDFASTSSPSTSSAGSWCRKTSRSCTRRSSPRR